MGFLCVSDFWEVPEFASGTGICSPDNSVILWVLPKSLPISGASQALTAGRQRRLWGAGPSSQLPPVFAVPFIPETSQRWESASPRPSCIPSCIPGGKRLRDPHLQPSKLQPRRARAPWEAGTNRWRDKDRHGEGFQVLVGRAEPVGEAAVQACPALSPWLSKVPISGSGRGLSSQGLSHGLIPAFLLLQSPGSRDGSRNFAGKLLEMQEWALGRGWSARKSWERRSAWGKGASGGTFPIPTIPWKEPGGGQAFPQMNRMRGNGLGFFQLRKSRETPVPEQQQQQHLRGCHGKATVSPCPCHRCTDTNPALGWAQL